VVFFSSLLETLARFRPDIVLYSELREIDGDDDFVPPGRVSKEWLDQIA
jgi:hypothetical protein